MPGIGHQRHRPDGDAIARLDDDKGRVEHDPHREGLAETGRGMAVAGAVMVVMVVAMMMVMVVMVVG
ncbi:hypothetical protein NUTIK01_17580 [Novosphingobium sp. IK01]|uniref:Uncharacterized protein n=1 Tax=Novosphingobium pituita TaxID=3056842 RepID=A0ABQ6P6W4_9SPHN|nr:hypothetical protein NUTIK01_17580 [Novosphingobium sp. IK01]